jgi:hypothetical protein
MCLPVSRLFWVLSLAYPNLPGTKGYVIVVVVVVDKNEQNKLPIRMLKYKIWWQNTLQFEFISHNFEI